MARVSAFQAEGCGFETRLPLQFLIVAIGFVGIALKSRQSTCPCGSVVEHTLGKGEVAGSIPAMGSTEL